MGNNLAIEEGDLQVLSQQSKYSEDTIRGMHKKFVKLDRTEKGYVGRDDLNQISDFKNSDMNSLICQQLTGGVSDQIDFKKLLLALSAFHYNDQDAKLKFLFDLCDRNKQGKLRATDLSDAFKMIQVEHYSEADLKEFATQTVKFADQDGDGALNFEEFKQFYNSVLQITI